MTYTFFSNNKNNDKDFYSSRENPEYEGKFLSKLAENFKINSILPSLNAYLKKIGNNQPNLFRFKAFLADLVAEKTSLFLAGIGILVSGYSIFRLSTDSHLVCNLDDESGRVRVAQANKVLTSQDSLIEIQSRDHTELSPDENYSISILDEKKSDENSAQGQATAEHHDTTENFVIIDLSGAVKKPGLYKVPANSRIGDVLSTAGGISVQASAVEVAQAINLASKVRDGQKIYIPFLGENLAEILRKEQRFSSLEEINEEKTTQENLSNESGIESFQTKLGLANSQAGSGSSSKTDEENLFVSINVASATQLMELKGIGEKRAADIIAGRPYTKLEELVSKGILTQRIFGDIQTQIKL